MKKTSVKYKSAVNVTLPAAAARAPARCSNRSIVGTRRQQLSIDICWLPAPRLRQAADIDRRDRQTDGRTDIRPLQRPSTAYYAGSVNKQVSGAAAEGPVQRAASRPSRYTQRLTFNVID